MTDGIVRQIPGVANAAQRQSHSQLDYTKGRTTRDMREVLDDLGIDVDAIARDVVDEAFDTANANIKAEADAREEARREVRGHMVPTTFAQVLAQRPYRADRWRSTL